MARGVRKNWKSVPEETQDALREAKDMTTTGAYNRLKRRKVKPTTDLKTIRQMAKQAEKRSKIPIRITTRLGKRNTKADGTCVTDVTKNKLRTQVRLHPYLQYYNKRYIRDVIGHELDHAEADKRRYLNKRRSL